MKKKIILTFLYFSIFFWITLETNAFLWFQVKKSTDSSYASSVENVSQSQELTFNVIKTDWSTSAKTFLVNMPSWFTYNGYTNNWCANFSLKTNSNSSFSYSYDYSSPCNVTFRYTPTTATSWNKQISLIYDWTATIVDVSIASSTTKTITKAVTKDLDNDWYIDAYQLNFSTAVSDISATWISWLTVWWYNVTSYSWTTTSWYILFQDWIFNTWERPQIISSWTIFWDVWQLWNDSIIEEDWAKPILLKVNNQNVVWVSNVSIWTWTITFEFSEKLHPQSIFYFKKWSSLIATLWSSSISNEKLIYTPSTELTIWSYSLEPTSDAKDYSSNLNTIWSISISLLVNDLSAPTWLAIWTTTWISINNWTATTNNRYVQLSLLASDNVWVHQMWISNDSSFSSWNWENYSESKINWDLWSTTWLRTVYIKFRDAAWNISPTYSASITYSTWVNYLSFNTPSSLYTDNTSITLDWWCNIPANPINYSINNGSVLTITCNWDKTWSKTFSPLLPDTQNQIKIWYWTDYDSATIKNSITIINPQTSCDTTKYTRVWSTCVPKSCESETKVVDWKTYQVPALSHSSNGNITSNSVSITWWNITYTQSFSCSFWTITANWTATANTPACNSWYSISWSSCIPSSCSAQTKTVNWRTYQVPTLSHSSNGNVTSNTVSISWWTITYTQSFSCSFWVLSENWSETTNTPTCNSWYAINWNQCTLISALACAGSYTDWDKIYWVWTITHLWTWTRTSSPISISNWTITYNQQFSCNATVLIKVWSATANTPTCDSWYSISWSSCVPSNCSAETKVLSNWNTYQVPSLIHNTSWTITSNNVSITWWRISYSQTFKCELWVISAVWSETTNTPTCNSWYKVDWLTCVKKSSSWWWGWWWWSFLPTCNTSTDLECRVSWTRYLWQVKFWANCQWWDVGKVCSSEEVKTWNSESNIDLWQDFINYINKNSWGINKEPTLEITKSYLLENTNKSFVKLIEDFRNKIYDKNIEYFITFDKDLKNKYISTLVTYKTLFENLDKQLNNKDQTAAINAKQNYSDLDKYISEIKNPEERYVTKKQDENNVIFETNTANIKNTMSWIEKIMFLKYKKLLQTNTIDKEKYNEIVDDYNNFVLYLSIFRNYKDEKAWKLWKEYLSKVVNHYNTKITEKKVIINNETRTTQKIIDVFPLTKDLKFWDYNDEVTTLQKMLKHYWYFDLEPTWYFWNTTWASLEKFTKEFLKTNYNWYLNENIRQKLSELDY